MLVTVRPPAVDHGAVKTLREPRGLGAGRVPGGIS